MTIPSIFKDIQQFNTDLDQLISYPNKSNFVLFLDISEKNHTISKNPIDLTTIPFKFAKVIVDSIKEISEKIQRVFEQKPKEKRKKNRFTPYEKSNSLSTRKIDILKSLEKTLTAVAETLKSKPKYDKQIQLSLSKDDAEILKVKAEYKGIPVKTIDLTDTKKADAELREHLKDITHKSRIYIIGHGGKGLSIVADSPNASGVVLSTYDFALIFGKYAKQLKKEDDQDPDQKLKISVVSCHGGESSETGKPGFAQKLSKELGDENIPALVVGRNETVAIMPSFNKNVNNIHQAPGRKIGFEGGRISPTNLS